VLDEMVDTEDMAIVALEQKLDFLKANQNMVDAFEAINKVRETSYVGLNTSGVDG
jgi:hypothetical protein